MRKSFTITGKDLLVETRKTAKHAEVGDEMVVSGEAIEVSDGFHTMREVYQQRYAIFVALLHAHAKTAPGYLDLDNQPRVWKSQHHSDCELGETLASFESHKCSMFKDSFVCGINSKPGEQITYHLPIKMWDEVIALILLKAPEWDGHTAADVIERLKRL